MNSIKELKDMSSSYNLLYVEDDIEIAQTFMHYLSKFFKRVVHAKNGKEGLALYKNEDFAIIITDIQMPEMNGLDMSFEIKKHTTFE